MKKAILLLSGGLDSATCFAIAKAEGYAVHALSFDYGQRHRVELELAKAIAQDMGAVEHRIATIDLRLFGGSALTEDAIAVPKHDTTEEIGKAVPVTYVPARNTIFLSFALAYAEVTQAFDIFLGVNALDYSGYPDCRPDYIDAFGKMANLALSATTEGNQQLTLHTPLLHLTKAGIIKKGLELGVDYAITTSCYDPDEAARACGHCDSCLLRKKGFAENGITDPVPYRA